MSNPVHIYASFLDYDPPQHNRTICQPLCSHTASLSGCVEEKGCQNGLAQPLDCIHFRIDSMINKWRLEIVISDLPGTRMRQWSIWTACLVGFGGGMKAQKLTVPLDQSWQKNYATCISIYIMYVQYKGRNKPKGFPNVFP